MVELSANARRRAIRPRTRIGVGAVVLALGLSTAALGMTATGSAATATSNWTQPDGDAGRTRFNPNETVLGKSNVGTLHVAWRLKGDGNCTPWFGTVANGLVYVGECDTPAVSAYDLATGHLRWHQDVPGQDWAAGPPTIANGRLYVVTHDVNELVALDAKTGRGLWAMDLTFANYFESPSVANGVVIAGRQAFDAVTGKQLWGIAWNDAHKCGPSLALDIAVTISGNSVYLRCGDGSLETRDLKTGAIRAIRPSTPDGTTPVVAGGIMYYGSAGRLVARRATNGALVWQAAAGASVGQPAVGAGAAVAIVGGRKVESFDLATGRAEWIRDVGAEAQPPAVANGIVYVRTACALRALDAGTGAVLRTVATRCSSGRSGTVGSVAGGWVFSGSEALVS